MRGSHTEQGQGSREVVGATDVVFRQKFICGDSLVGRGVVVVQDPVARAPLLRAMSAYSITESLQDCFVEVLICCLSCRDELMINQPVSVEERNPAALSSVEMMMCSTGRTFALFPGHTRKPGDRGGTVVKVLCYKSEGHRFDPRWCHWNFSLT